MVILFAEIWIFARMEKQKFLQIFGLDIPVLSDLTGLVAGARPNRQVLAGTVLAGRCCHRRADGQPAADEDSGACTDADLPDADR